MTIIELPGEYHNIICITLYYIFHRLDILRVHQICVDSSIASKDDASFDEPMINFDTAAHYGSKAEVKGCT